MLLGRSQRTSPNPLPGGPRTPHSPAASAPSSTARSIRGRSSQLISSGNASRATALHHTCSSSPASSPGEISDEDPSQTSASHMVAPLSKSRSSRTLPCVVQSLHRLCSDGRVSEALEFLPVLLDKGIRLPAETLAFLVSRCATLKQVKWVHLHLKLTGLKRPGMLLSNRLIAAFFRCGSEFHARKMFDEMPGRNLYSWNNVLSGYAKLGRMRPARKLFDQMPERDTVSWNTMLIGYAKGGDCGEAIRVYKEFQALGMRPSKFSFAGLLTVCSKLRELELTRQVHGQVLAVGYSSNIVLLSSILDAYAKCGEMTAARKVFDEMEIKDVLVWTTLLSGYARSGDMSRASKVFLEMPVKNSVSWTALIAGYVRNGLAIEALQLFAEMMALRILPDQFTFSSSLCACASLAALKHGKQIHAHMIRTNFRPNTVVVSSLIDMYSKCGNLGYARLVFDLLGDKKEIISWNTMLSALAQHGLGKTAVEMFNSMVGTGIKPDRITFVILLSACSHSGALEEGVGLFKSMIQDHRVFPDQEHYACFIDLLGRAGLFAEVVDQLKKMPIKPDDRVWNSLLGVCKIHGNVALGEEAADLLIKLQPSSSAAYVFLSSVYSALGKWDSVAEVRKLMNDRSVRKERSISWLESENKGHSFTVSDESHPMKEEIYATVNLLAGHVAEEDES